MGWPSKRISPEPISISQVAGDLARGGREADVVHGQDAGETLGDVAQFERHLRLFFDTARGGRVPGKKGTAHYLEAVNIV
jgi:hypothetical protein